jgi:hypothetical protein
MLIAPTACQPRSGASTSSAPPLTTAPATSSQVPAAASSGPRRRAPVAVAIVVDQLGAWVAESRWPLLPADGGFARLRREGTWVKRARYAHAVTDTAPGHAALHTGQPPMGSGVWANELPMPGGGRASILRDDAVKMVLPGGATAARGSSAWPLRAPTVADELREMHPDAVIVSVSIKDRAAIIPGGRKPSAAIWFESSVGEMATSTAFADRFPAWAVARGARDAIARDESKPWTLLDPAWVKAHAASDDDAPGEGDLDGMGRVFPHAIKSHEAFRGVPAADELVLGLGLDGLRALARPDRPTLLLLSLTANDVTGHTFGPDSWEAYDLLRRLDGALGRFIAELDEIMGEPVPVLLSADHGTVSMPETARARAQLRCDAPDHADPYDRPCEPGERMSPSVIAREIGDAVNAELGDASLVAGVADPYVFLSEKARALPAARRAKLDKAIRGALAKHRGIEAVLAKGDLSRDCPAALANALPAPERAAVEEPALTLVCRSVRPESGDYFMLAGKGSFFDAEIVLGRGGSHGSRFLFDRTVPMLMRVPGALAAGEVIETPVDFTAFSAVLRATLRITRDEPREALARASSARP